MTKREAAIVSAYTGVLCGEFANLQRYAEEKFGRPLFSHEFGSAEFAHLLRQHARLDFVGLVVVSDDAAVAAGFAPTKNT